MEACWVGESSARASKTATLHWAAALLSGKSARVEMRVVDVIFSVYGGF